MYDLSHYLSFKSDRNVRLLFGECLELSVEAWNILSQRIKKKNCLGEKLLSWKKKDIRGNVAILAYSYCTYSVLVLGYSFLSRPWSWKLQAFTQLIVPRQILDCLRTYWIPQKESQQRNQKKKKSHTPLKFSSPSLFPALIIEKIQIFSVSPFTSSSKIIFMRLIKSKVEILFTRQHCWIFTIM